MEMHKSIVSLNQQGTYSKLHWERADKLLGEFFRLLQLHRKLRINSTTIKIDRYSEFLRKFVS